MGKLIDLTGQRFGRLVVLERAGSDSNKKATWLCQCDCGKTTIVIGRNLLTGNTSSCGCFERELSIGEHRHRIHGGTYSGGRKTRLMGCGVA